MPVGVAVVDLPVMVTLNGPILHAKRQVILYGLASDSLARVTVQSGLRQQTSGRLLQSWIAILGFLERRITRNGGDDDGRTSPSHA